MIDIYVEGGCNGSQCYICQDDPGCHIIHRDWQFGAVEETTNLLNRSENRPENNLPETMRPEHLRKMYFEIATEPHKFQDSGKLGRWLGWMQASVVALGYATVEDFMEMNRRFKDGKES